jgi:hypothetical protein
LDAFPVAQSRNHRAAAFLAEHVTVGEPELAARLLDDLASPCEIVPKKR